MASFYIPSNTEKEEWLMQHVPHRVCAGLAWLPMPEKRAVPRPDLPNMNFGVWCVDRCVEEGNKAAMRWLIEFVGVKHDRKSDGPVPIKADDNGKSVTIAQVGGTMFDTTKPGARKLAKIWQACSQASGHPTADTKHDPLDREALASALCIVIDHLETALYKPSNLDLCKIVHDQEQLAIDRMLKGQPTNAPGLGTGAQRCSAISQEKTAWL
jgi:hypothetical protein